MQRSTITSSSTEIMRAFARERRFADLNTTTKRRPSIACSTSTTRIWARPTLRALVYHAQHSNTTIDDRAAACTAVVRADMTTACTADDWKNRAKDRRHRVYRRSDVDKRERCLSIQRCNDQNVHNSDKSTTVIPTIRCRCQQKA